MTQDMAPVHAVINGRWNLQLLPHREEFHSKRPTWEIGRVEHCAERMKPGMTVYDVGAEEGDFTALYRGFVGHDGEVVPIEPQPAYWPAIRQTWEANGFAPPAAWFPGFAGATTTVHEFPEYLAELGWPVEDWPTCADDRVRPDFGFRHLAQQAESTPQVRLDAFADISGVVPDAIVKDIEGAEVLALQGCEGLCTGPNPPLLWVSVHEPPMLDWYGVTLDDHDAMWRYHTAKWGGRSGQETLRRPFGDAALPLSFWPTPPDARCRVHAGWAYG